MTAAVQSKRRRLRSLSRRALFISFRSGGQALFGRHYWDADMTMDIFSLFTWIATVVALMLSVWQLWAARAQTKQLVEIHRSVSTRYIGTFPSYLPEIAATVQDAKDELIIFCDFPAYGCFSDPSGWLRYRHAIERQLLEKKVRVDLICLSDIARHKMAEKYYDQSWLDQKRISDSKFVEKIARYLKVCGVNDNPNTITSLTLTKHLETDDTEALLRTFRGAHITQVAEYVPLYFWISDRKQAIFAFPGFADLSIEHGFATTDTKLLNAFLEVKERYATNIAKDAIL